MRFVGFSDLGQTIWRLKSECVSSSGGRVQPFVVSDPFDQVGSKMRFRIPRIAAKMPAIKQDSHSLIHVARNG